MDMELLNRGTEGELVLAGRLDGNTAKDAERIFLQMVERFDKLIINLEKLEYISSAGLRAVRNLYLAMRKKAGNLYVKGANKTVMEVFEVTGLVGWLDFI